MAHNSKKKTSEVYIIMFSVSHAESNTTLEEGMHGRKRKMFDKSRGCSQPDKILKHASHGPRGPLVTVI